MTKLVGRIKGTLRCADGAVVPITSKRVLDAIRERDAEIERMNSRISELRKQLDSESAQLTAARADLRNLRGCAWVCMGRWLRLVPPRSR